MSHPFLHSWFAAADQLWNLSATGYGNLFYAAAAEAGSHSWSVLAPQALMGAASVAVLYAAVRRAFDDARIGTVAGLVAGPALACTPAAALIFRFNNPDALLVLVLTVAGYCLIRAAAAASWRWLELAGIAMGAAFLTKMLEGLPSAACVRGDLPAVGADRLATASDPCSWPSATAATGIARPISRRRPSGTDGRGSCGGTGLGVLAAVGGAAAFSIVTAATPHQGSIPAALRRAPPRWATGRATRRPMPTSSGCWPRPTRVVGGDERLPVGCGAGGLVWNAGDGDRRVEWRPGAHTAVVHRRRPAGKITYYVEAGRGGLTPGNSTARSSSATVPAPRTPGRSRSGSPTTIAGPSSADPPSTA